jgi:hypothetical protein
MGEWAGRRVHEWMGGQVDGLVVGGVGRCVGK